MKYSQLFYNYTVVAHTLHLFDKNQRNLDYSVQNWILQQTLCETTNVTDVRRCTVQWNGETCTVYAVLTLACKKPSHKSIVKTIISRSGTMHTTGRNSAFTEASSSVRPAYSGIIVANTPTFASRAISWPSNWKIWHMQNEIKWLKQSALMRYFSYKARFKRCLSCLYLFRLLHTV